jgi:hypothetical protein
MFPRNTAGEPFWKLWDFDNTLKSDSGRYALDRFERKGILLPYGTASIQIEIASDCASNDGVYCSDPLPSDTSYDDHVCSSGFEQLSYDRCCEIGNSQNCEYAHVPQPTMPSPAPITAFDPEYGICP